MTLTVYLDLEDTVINPLENGWSAATFLPQLQPIINFLADNKIDKVNIFSFAVDTKFAKNAFELHVKERLESELHVKVDKVLTHADIALKCGHKQCEDISYLSVLNNLGKRTAFICHCNSLEQEGNFVLIDDAVKNEVLKVSYGTIHFIDATQI